MTTALRWGVLGIGRVTPRMVAAIRAVPNQSIHAVAARDGVKLQSWAQEFDVPSATTSFQELVDSTEIDAIYNALPPSLHSEWSIAALKAGKRVLCEKPLAMSWEDAKEMEHASHASSVPLWHATAFPFHPRNTAMREIVLSGELGSIKRVTVACSASHILKRGKDHRTDASLGGGCLKDLGWYCVYATHWMTGLAVEHVKAVGKRIDSRDPNSPWLSVQVLATLESGAIALWDCGFDAAGRKWMEIAGSEGSIICDDIIRPWDTEKPRFWVHGHDGKGRGEIVGAGFCQEAAMVESIANGTLEQSNKSLHLALHTHRILDLIEAELR